ncbi:MAG: DUF1349 domain-containing protein [Xenococcaceae cyanobacterium]
MEWLNEPVNWSNSDKQIVVNTLPKTDFWRITHYGFIRDNGHFYFERVNTDFVVDVEIRGNYKALYDQAGIMIRVDEKHWIKAGIEYVDGVQNLSAVVTHNYSDWSMTPLHPSPSSLRLRVERHQEAIHISYADENSNYVPFRLAYFPSELSEASAQRERELQVGIMCASPEGEGFEVVFENYRLKEQSAKN